MLSSSLHIWLVALLVSAASLGACAGSSTPGRGGCRTCTEREACVATPQHGETITYSCLIISPECLAAGDRCACIQEENDLHHYRCSESAEGVISLLCCQSTAAGE